MGYGDGEAISGGRSLCVMEKRKAGESLDHLIEAFGAGCASRVRGLKMWI